MYNRYNSNNIVLYWLLLQRVSDTEAGTQNVFLNIAGSHHSKNIANPWWCVHFHLGQRPPPKGVEHSLCPSAGRAQGRLRAAYSVQSLSYLYTARRSKWHRHRTCVSDWSRPQTRWIIVFTWNLSPRRTSCCTVAQCHQPPPSIHYKSRDHPNAHELTNHIQHPSPAPGLRSPGAPGKALCRLYGMVPVSPTGTTASHGFPRILSMGMTLKTGILESSPYTIREPKDSSGIQPT